MHAPRYRAQLALLMAVPVLLTSCAGGSEEEARQLKQRSIVEDPPALKRVLITEDEIEKQPAGSPQRAFLQFWSMMQHQSWADAVETYDRELQQAAGPENLTEALKSQAAYLRAVRPRLTSTVRRGAKVTTKYVVQDTIRRDTPRSITWIRTAAGWKIYYDPFLDEALRGSVQQATQNSLDPTARTPGKRALTAGAGASRIQSTYLKERLDAQRAAPEPQPSTSP